MSLVRPIDAAFEGFRIVREKPGLILAWTGFYLLSLLAMVGVLLIGLGPKLMTLAPAEAGMSGGRDFDQLFARFGLPLLIVIPMALIMSTMLAGAVYRSVLRPEDKGFSYLKFGSDELRLLGVSLIVVAFFVVLSGVYGAAVVALSHRLEGLAYGLTTAATSIGGLVLTLWLAVRLSLSAAMTFSERRIALWSAWKLTRGHAPRLLAMWGMTILFVFGVTLLAAIASWMIAGLLGGFRMLEQLNVSDLSNVSPGMALALLGQLLVQMAIQVLLLVLLLVVAYSPPGRAYQQIKGEV